MNLRGLACVDMHAHFYGGGLVEVLRKRTCRPCLKTREDGVEVMLAMNGEFAFKPDYHDPAIGLAQMAKFGFTKRLLTFPGALCLDVLPAREIGPAIGEFNDHLAALRTQTSGGLTGLAGLPLENLEMAVAELRRIRRDLRLPGVILPANYFDTVEFLESVEPLLRTANETHSHIMVHPGLKVGEVAPDLATDHPQYRISAVQLQSRISQNVLTLILSGVMERYPHISFQIVNLGGTIPFVIERMESIARHRNPQNPFPTNRLRNLWYDCASLGPRALETAVGLYGADRVMLGSDYPIFLDNPIQTALMPANLSDEDKALICGVNAADLLKRLESA